MKYNISFWVDVIYYNNKNMKTISLELSKRLNEAWVLDNIETKYNWYYHAENDWYLVERLCHLTTRGIKTLTLEEAIKILPNFTLDKVENEYIYYHKWKHVKSSNLLEIIEKMLGYLLDNKLLWHPTE